MRIAWFGKWRGRGARFVIVALAATNWLATWSASCVRAADAREAALSAAVATVTDGELLGHAGTLADDALEGREAGSRGGLAAARYIEGRLSAARLRPAGEAGAFAQRFNGNMQNLLAVLPGSDPQLADEVVLVGAHYDHVGYGSRANSNGPIGYIHNGADDNASGVAAVLEIVDALVTIDYRPRRTILFAFWDGEEKNLLGSRHWVRRPTLPLKSVKTAVNVDMVGRLRDGVLTVGGTRTGYGSRRLTSSERLPAGMRLDYSWEFKENSDHWPLFEAGVPSLVINTGLHDDYHRPSDDVEKLNVAGMRQVSQYLVEVVMRLADADELPKYRAAGRGETPSLAVVREAPLPPFPARAPVEWAARAAGDPAGVLVVAVRTTAGAEPLDLRPGDRVIGCDGRPIAALGELESHLLVAAKAVRLQVVGREADQPREVLLPLAGKPLRFGASWRADESEPGTVFLTRVVPYSAAARAGLAVGDRIDAVDGAPFADAAELLARLQESLDSGARELALRVERQGRVRTLAVDLTSPTEPSRDATL